MYQDHFGLYTAPFALSPRLQFVYNSTTFEETMAHLIYGIEGGEEIMLITGEIGTGKTLALKKLTNHISSAYCVALINITQVDFKELLKLFLVELGIEPQAGADRADLLIALQAHITALAADGMRCLLIVDEAQNMDSEILEGVRLLTNIGPADSQVLQIILSGQPSLRGRIDQPELLQLRQRIRVHYHLSALDESETRAYIDHRLKVAGASRQIFRGDAVSRIHRICGGIPRLVNIVADRALLSAYVEGASEVSAKHIEDDDGLVRSPEDETNAAAQAANAAEPVTMRVVEPLKPVKPVDAVEPEDEDQPVDEPILPAEETVSSSRRGVTTWIVVAALVLVAVLVTWRMGLLDQQDDPTAHDPAAVVQAPVDTLAAVAAPADSMPVLQEQQAEVESQVDSTTVPDAGEVATVDDPVVTSDEPVAVESADDGLLSAHHVPDYEGLSVHIGSFLEFERAESQAEAAEALGMNVSYKAVQLEETTWYRVYLGPFDDNEAAKAAEATIRSGDLATWTMIVRVR